MAHLVLAGDSVFDNAAYVGRGPCVAEQVRAALGAAWHVTRLARDGAVLDDVAGQLADLPAGATHLAISAGGNDVLRQAGLLELPVPRVAEALDQLGRLQEAFGRQYAAMLQTAAATRLPLVVATIYDAVPGLTQAARTALAVFNDSIVRLALPRKAAVLELRAICTRAADFAAVSPIEPSVRGGRRIAAALARFLTRHPSGWQECIMVA